MALFLHPTYQDFNFYKCAWTITGKWKL